MHRFKVGQKVVAIETHNLGWFKKGDIFTVDGLGCCNRCGEPNITLIELNKIVDSECLICGLVHEDIRQRYRQSRFAPLQSSTDAIEYKMKVSLPELLTLKQYQEQ